MKKNLFLLLASLVITVNMQAQLSGVYNIPTNYTTVASAIAALNSLGISGSVTISINAGYTETAPAGGYTLTATGSLANSIVFQKTGTGANPLLTAFSGGTATSASAVQDGIWSFIGSDYVTIDGIDLVDPNTTNNATMEYGYGLFKSSATDGCNFVLIKNCTITLNRINNTTGSGPSTDGSRGINVVNALISSQTTSLVVTSPAGSNSGNKFYANTIQNCNTCISITGFPDTTPFSYADNGNDIGGISAITSNTLINYGGVGTNPAMAVRTREQQALNISFNRINNNNGSGVQHTAVLKGIFVEDAASANVTIKSNTLSLKFGGTSAQVSVIENLAGSSSATNTVDISSNLISNCTNTATTSGVFYGIYNSANCPNLFVRSNTFSGNTTASNGGAVYLIYNTGTVTSAMSFTANTISHSYNGSFGNTGPFYGIFSIASASTAVINMNNNLFSNLNYAISGSGSVGFITNFGPSNSFYALNNIFSNLYVNNDGQHRLISNYGSCQQLYSISGNSIVTGYTRTGSTGSTILINAGAVHNPVSTGTISNNYMANIVNSGTTTGTFNGFTINDGSNTPGAYSRKSIFNNVLSNITYSTTNDIILYTFSGFGEGGTGIASSIYNNLTSNVISNGGIIGYWILQNMGGALPVAITANTLSSLNSYTAIGGIGNTAKIRCIYVSCPNGAGINISATKIFSLSAAGNQSEVYGVYVIDSYSTTLSNNVIGNLYTPYGYGNAVMGIYLGCPTGSINLFYNTVYLNGTSTINGFGSSCLYSSGFESLSMKNNILINNSTPVGFGRTIAYYRASIIKSTYGLSSDHNIFYAGAASNAYLMSDAISNYANMPQLKTAYYPREANSFSENTSFASIAGSSSLFLHINLNVFSLSGNNAINITGIGIDTDTDIRQGYPGYLGAGTAPDIGADEYDANVPNCSSVSSSYIAPQTPTYCAGTNFVVNSNITPSTATMLYQWKSSTVQGGPYSNVLAGGGINSTSYISPTLSPGVYYFILTNTCSINTLTNSSNEATVTVLPPPVASISVSNNSSCTGGVISLSTPSISGLSYSWNGPLNFSSSSATSTFIANSTDRTGTYSLSVNSTNGCFIYLNTFITVKNSPTSLTVSPTSSAICLGSTVTLNVSGGLISNAFDVGTGTTVNSYTEHLSPYTLFKSGERMQMLVTAAELSNAGILPNTPLTSIQFPVTAQGLFFANGNITNQTFSVKIATTTLTHFTHLIGFQGPLTLISSSSAFKSTVGYDNYHIFSTPVIWNGTSNIIIETSFSNNSYLPFPLQGAVYQNYTNTPDTMTIVYANDNQSAVNIANASSVSNYYKARPNFRLNGLIAAPYNWSPSTGLSSTTGSSVNALPLMATQYTAVVNDGTCVATGMSNITVAYTPTMTAMVSNGSICAGQTVLLTASGASNYLWNTGNTSPSFNSTPLSTFIYIATGSNAPCPPVTASVQVLVSPLPVISVVVSPTAVCYGESATLTASGANSYLWNTGSTGNSIAANPLASTVFNVIGTNSQLCQSNANGALIVNPLPSILITANSLTICEGEFASLTATGANNYTWQPSGVTAPSLSLQLQGTTQVTVTGESIYNCINTKTIELISSACTGISEGTLSGPGFKIYPNPSQSTIKAITSQNDLKLMRLLNYLGETVAEIIITGGTATLDVTLLARGAYIIEIMGNRNYYQKVILN